MGVTAKHREYAAAETWWQRCEDVQAGGDAVKAAGRTYLPALPGQSDAEYRAYVERALFYNATSRTVQGLNGAILGKPPQVAGVPKAVEAHVKDVTRTGVSLDGFAQRVIDRILLQGRAGILVDLPQERTGEGPRPYWVLYKAASIVNWRRVFWQGEQVLTLVVLAETTEAVDEDGFTVKVRPQYRELRLVPSADSGRWAYQVVLWHQDETDNQKWIPSAPVTPLRAGQPLDRIPFVFLSSLGIEPEVVKPPLLDLVDVNLSHYRTSADLEHGRHYTAIPQIYTAGWSNPPSPTPVGPTSIWHMADPQARADILEFTGKGLGELSAGLKEKEEKMAVLGARLLESQARAGVEAAETVRLRHSGEHATLKTIAQSVSLGLTNALQWHAYWWGLDEREESGVSVALSTEFFDVRLSPDEVRMLLLQWQAGAISYETFFAQLTKGGWTRPGVTADQERAAIDQELPAPSPDPPPADDEDDEDEDADPPPTREGRV